MPRRRRERPRARLAGAAGGDRARVDQRRRLPDPPRGDAAGEHRPAARRLRLGAALLLPARRRVAGRPTSSPTSPSRRSTCATGRRSSATGPYLIPLLEELALPDEIRAKANPKSSTGRLDVFTRVITDRNHRFDEIRPGYHGQLYLEVVPRSFAIYVRQGLALNQLRLSTGDARLDDAELVSLHQQFPLLYVDQHPLRETELAIADGLFLSVDLRSGPRPRSRLPGEEEQPADRPEPDPRLPLERLLGSGPSRGGLADRARAGDLLPAAVRRGGLHPARATRPR